MLFLIMNFNYKTKLDKANLKIDKLNCFYLLTSVVVRKNNRIVLNFYVKRRIHTLNRLILLINNVIITLTGHVKVLVFDKHSELKVYFERIKY